YQICENNNPANCDTAIVTITVDEPVIDAVADSANNVNGYTGANAVVNIFTNDLLNAVAVNPMEVTLTQVSGDMELTLNANGSVDVAAGTPAGTYTLTYQICENNNPTNCDTAVVTVTVIAPAIDAITDSANNINGYTGAAAVVNVFTNDLLNGVAVNPAEVTLMLVSGDTELTLNPNGSVAVAAGTPAGTYTLTYPFCENNIPANCDTAIVTITVDEPVIDAVADSVNNVNGYTGATGVVNVFDNDLLNGVAVIPSEVTLTLVTGDSALTLNTDGSVDVA